MLAQATNDERNEFLGDFKVIAIRPKALSVKLPEGVARQFKSLGLLLVFRIDHVEDGISRA
jgi:hypothetical protein